RSGRAAAAPGDVGDRHHHDRCWPEAARPDQRPPEPPIGSRHRRSCGMRPLRENSARFIQLNSHEPALSCEKQPHVGLAGEVRSKGCAMEMMSCQVLALVVGLLKGARSDAAFRKLLDESPDLCGLMDPLQGLALPQPEPDAPRGSTQAGALSLTPRQCDILRLIAVGRSNKEIARITGVTPETVKTHV